MHNVEHVVNITILCHHLTAHTVYSSGGVAFTHNDPCILIVLYKSVVKPYELVVFSN